MWFREKSNIVTTDIIKKSGKTNGKFMTKLADKVSRKTMLIFNRNLKYK